MDREIFRRIIKENQEFIKEVELYNKIYMQLTEFYQPLNQEFIQKYFPKQP